MGALNGTELGGKTIEVDVWTQKVKMAMKTVNSVLNKFAKKATVTVDAKTLEKLSKIDHSLKVYIGGLAETVTWKRLEKHAAELAKKPAVTFVRPHKGTACLAFKEEEDVGNAIAALNGSELQGKVLEADVWTKPEKK